MDARSRCFVLEGLHCDVHFVFSEEEVRYLGLTERMMSLGNLDVLRRPSALSKPPRLRVFPRGLCDGRAKLTASNARRRFGRNFGRRDYALTRAGDDAVHVESSPMLRHSAMLDFFAPISSALPSVNFPHGSAVPGTPVTLLFCTLRPHVRGYTAAIFERFVTFE